MGGGAAFNSTSVVKSSQDIGSSEANKTNKTNKTNISQTDVVKSMHEDRSVISTSEHSEGADSSASTTDDSLTWTRDDFNITSDGKQIGYRKLVKTPTGNVDKIIKGLNANGLAKLKKNPHIVIPDGIEVIGEVAFKGNTTKVGEETKHIDGEQYIESVTLPQSLKIIGYGAFGWNKIKGTVTIPANVISIQSGAFHANEIQKVVFDGKIDGKDKLNNEDKKEYYLAGILEYAFSRNKISEIDFANKTSDYELLPKYGLNNNMKKMPFFGQEFEIKVRVGDEFKNPLIIKQNVKNPETIYSYGGFVTSKNATNYALAENTGYFTKTKDGKIIASKPGTLYGAWMLCDSHEGCIPSRPIITANFTYKILPKIYTVTFVDGSNSSVRQVEDGYSINGDSLTDQSMPDNPTKSGFTFNGWFTRKDGKDDKKFTGDTTVTGDMSVYSSYTPIPPTPPTPPDPTPKPEPKPEPEPVPEPKPAPKPEPAPTPNIPDQIDEPLPMEVPFIIGPAVVTSTQPDLKQHSAEPKPASTPAKQAQNYNPQRQKQGEYNYTANHAAKHLPETGSATTSILVSAIASLFAGLASFAESFAANRKRRN